MSRKTFRPLPSDLRGLRDRARYSEFARFYGSFDRMNWKIGRFSFQVEMSPWLSNNEKYRLIVTTVNALRDNTIPEHEQGQVFRSFQELFHRTKWVRVRRLRQYKAGMVYER